MASEAIDDAFSIEIIQSDDFDTPTIKDLYFKLMPKVTLVKEISHPTSTYTSHHPEAACSMGNFQSIQTLQLPSTHLGNQSSFLLLAKKRNGRFGYSNVQDIQAYVEKYIEDILIALGWWETSVKLVRQQAMLGDTKADIWLVMLESGRPIGVIEVKVPDLHAEESKLFHPKVCGQMFDYITLLRVSYGQCEIFGIATTLDQWRIFWFPDTNAAAETRILSSGNNTSPASDLDRFLIGQTLVDTRCLVGSPLYSLNSRSLTVLITSVLLKCKSASYRILPQLSSDRVYHTITRYTYLWEKWDGSSTSELKFSLPRSNTQSFKVLRRFHPGADGKVVLAINSGLHLCVIKFHYADATRTKEATLWKEIFDVDVWTMKRHGYKDCLVLPFVFHCVVVDDSICFNFDLAMWSKENAAVVETSSVFNKWKERFSQWYHDSEWTPAMVAKLAIEKMAEKSFVHRDLEWRHVALLPIVIEDAVVGMAPVLIDLAEVYPCDEATALQEMNMKMKQLCHDYAVEYDDVG